MAFKAFSVGSRELNDYQISILDECLLKTTGGGLAIPMGSGKTLLSIIIALKQKNQGPILVVCAKSLLSSWITEIEKFFGKYLKYQVLHSNTINIDTWELDPNIQLVLTTSEVLGKYYRRYNINNLFSYLVETQAGHLITQTRFYRSPQKPFINIPIGGGIIYSIEWGCLIVDEAQNYSKSSTVKCSSIAAIYSPIRWLLSGTLFNEPSSDRIFGYYLLLNTGPKSLPQTMELITNPQYKGLRSTLVIREKNIAYKPPKIIENVIEHAFSQNEAKVYTSMKTTLKQLRKQLDEYKLANRMNRSLENRTRIKKFSSYLLAMITYVRQSLFCPIIPIATISIDIADQENNSELAVTLMDELKKLNLTEWLNDIESVKSSRVKKVLELLDKHKSEKVVLFSCFRTCLELLSFYLEKSDRPIFTISGNMQMARRGKVIDDYSSSDNGILLLTYDIGANGLNLQGGLNGTSYSTVVIMCDFSWNFGITKQAIARVVRYGNNAPIINIYYITSNSSIESALFKKMTAKLDIASELMDGSQTTKIPKMTLNDILHLISNDENTEHLNIIKNK
jgi:SNF2 family DNA or RNA helicase